MTIEPRDLGALNNRLFSILSDKDFLAMKGLANEVPIFIQTYHPGQEDGVRRMVDALQGRLRSSGVVAKAIDLFALVLEELDECKILDGILAGEASWKKRALLETMQNYADPKTHLIPRLMKAIEEDDPQVTLLTGPGRLFPFLRTHTMLESLQPAMIRHPVVMFFPGEYRQDSTGGSSLRLFGTLPIPRIHNAYYRAFNLDHYRLSQQ